VFYRRDTVDGLSDEEALWTALSAWATFQPRHSMLRKFPGKLFYPDGASHIFEACWNFLDDMSRSPGFSGKSPICQVAMLALDTLDTSKWAAQPTAEAPEKIAEIANDAAYSRLRPVADGPNQWDMHRSSAITVGSLSPGFPRSVPSQAPAQG
jgi:hypothetical protein